MATPEPDPKELRRIQQHGLRYVRPGEPGYSRIRRGKGFVYVDEQGRPLTQWEDERVRAIVIPPAWESVWICPDDNGHILATGVDVAGRKQYRYHQEWRRLQDESKFDSMLDFARALPELRDRVQRGLRRPDLDWDRMLAAAIRILDRAMIRVGFEEYLENETHGLVTLLRSHVEIDGWTIRLDFVGKASKRQLIEITDRQLVFTFRRLFDEDYTGTRLLAYREGDLFYDFKATDVNEHLEHLTGQRFTAKSFRTWHATMHAAVKLAVSGPPPEVDRARKRIITQVVKETSELLGNTPAVCRASYIDPRVFDRWEQQEMGGVKRAIAAIADPGRMSDADRNQLEAAVVAMLEGEDMLAALTRKASGAARRLQPSLALTPTV